VQGPVQFRLELTCAATSQHCNNIKHVHVRRHHQAVVICSRKHRHVSLAPMGMPQQDERWTALNYMHIYIYIYIYL